MSDPREVWLRGPLSDMPALLQPVAHALLQAGEELDALLADFPESKLWERPAGLASPGFHLQHLRGVLDRLFTYARGEMLTEPQLTALAAEGKPDGAATVLSLLQAFHHQKNACLRQLREEDASGITRLRYVGRAKIPSTSNGLYVHAAEHTMRHLGQLLVTVRILTRS